MRKPTCQDRGRNYHAIHAALVADYLLSKSEKSGKDDTKRDRHLRDSESFRLHGE